MVHCSREGAGKANRSKVWHVEIPIAYVGENGLHLFEWNQIYGAGWIRVTLRTRRRLHSKMTLLPWPTRMAVGTIPTTMMTEWTGRFYRLASRARRWQPATPVAMARRMKIPKTLGICKTNVREGTRGARERRTKRSASQFKDGAFKLTTKY